MQFQKILIPLGSLALVMLAYRSWGWAGIAVATGALVMWLLLHFTRLMQVLKRAARQPVGHVGSAVMLNAKLRTGASLLHVVALTKSLGEPLSAKGAQPEVFRWTDGSESQVTCEFVAGKLKTWALLRPIQVGEAANDAHASPAP